MKNNNSRKYSKVVFEKNSIEFILNSPEELYEFILKNKINLSMLINKKAGSSNGFILKKIIKKDGVEISIERKIYERKLKIMYR